MIRLTRGELITLRSALHRAVDWSDVNDNGKILGKEWLRGERRFIQRCEALNVKLSLQLLSTNADKT